jgi:hypothetical protein
MKKLFSGFALIAALVACGGGNDSGQSLLNNQTIYGFDAKGMPYSATINAKNNSYRYSKFDPVTGVTTTDTSVALIPSAANPSIYSISGHDQHTLAVDASQLTVLASTKSSVEALPEPTVFAAQPLTSFADIAGSYYLYSNLPYWYRINIASNGTITLDCKSFVYTESLEGSTLSLDFCEDFVAGSASIQPLTSPFWKITYSFMGNDVVNGNFTFEHTATMMFAKTATGRIAYRGAISAGSCSPASASCNPEFFNTLKAYQEAKNYAAPIAWPGTWAFNRQGGSSTVLSLRTTGTGTTSSGLNVASTLPFTLGNPDFQSVIEINMDKSLLGLNLTSYSTHTSIVNNLTGAIMVSGSDSDGQSHLNNFGGQLATADTRGIGSLNSSAIFEKIPLETKKIYIPATGVSGPYTLTIPEELTRVDSSMEVSIEVYNPNGPEVYSSTPITEGQDFFFNPFLGTIVFRAPVPSIDDQVRPVRITVKYALAPLGMTNRPDSWGVRVK